MNDHTLQKLYPHADTEPFKEAKVGDLYLKEDIPTEGHEHAPFVYANFVCSVDGRIAIPDQSPLAPPGVFSTPNHMTTTLDWTLFERLQAHASALVTHSGYLRALDQGRLGNALQIPKHPEAELLRRRRQSLGLTDQPTIIIVSRSLEFPIPESLNTDDQPTIVLTSNRTKQTRIRDLQSRNVSVIQVGHDGWITATDVIEILKARQLPNLYLQTGPELLHSMLKEKFLNRLYLTTDFSLTGGDPFVPILNGEALQPPGKLRLRSMYLSTRADKQNNSSQQLFSCFDVNP